MTDNLTKVQRSKNMSKIRSKWTKPELLVHHILLTLKIPHKMHPKLDGNPDIILKKEKIAIFVHGCFWHKCPKCYVEPKSNRKYWIPKIARNVERDKENRAKLSVKGYKSLTIWGHELKGY